MVLVVITYEPFMETSWYGNYSIPYHIGIWLGPVREVWILVNAIHDSVVLEPVDEL